MAKYEFRFIITGVELPDHVQENISRAVAEAGALALGEHTPSTAVTFPIGPNIWWRGIPTVEVIKAVEQMVIGINPTAGAQGTEGGHDAAVWRGAVWKPKLNLRGNRRGESSFCLPRGKGVPERAVPRRSASARRHDLVRKTCLCSATYQD